ncbi:unnamed protein product [Adineta steineri]|uniref:Uncharacterized protein n=1 Tax=Adineta steineri TaxID=433720 RepID=A0A814A4R3_9BILA|nr:unnamed protein product [Adineta steineri]CAF3508139.1 unnamed protein product [Adineta steineri]
MIINKTKNDLDKATRTVNELSITVAEQDLISELRVERNAKQGVSRIEITCFININGSCTITADETEPTYSSNIKYIYLLKHLLNNEEKVSDGNKKIIESTIEKQLQWLEANQDAEVVELMAHKQQIEVIVTQFIIQLYEEAVDNEVKVNEEAGGGMSRLITRTVDNEFEENIPVPANVV